MIKVKVSDVPGLAEVDAKLGEFKLRVRATPLEQRTDENAAKLQSEQDAIFGEALKVLQDAKQVDASWTLDDCVIGFVGRDHDMVTVETNEEADKRIGEEMNGIPPELARALTALGLN